MSSITVFPMGFRRHALVCGLVLATGLLAALPACGGKQGDGKVDYSVSAKQNYDKGLKKLEDKDWVAAAKYFRFVKARFPYSRYAVLAELRLADAEFGAGHYLQAIETYKTFIKLHPTHEMVTNGYGAFRIGESYFKMLPGDWWILPPSFEKDQSATEDAHKELSGFVQKHGDSEYATQAREMLLRINRKLAEHELYVARFYWKRNRPMGTVLRLRRLLERHQGSGLDAEALYLLGKAYVKVNMPDRARSAWERLVREFPDHESTGSAQAALGRLPG